MLGAVSDWVGYVGAALIVFAYFLNQRGRLASADWRFPATNLLGSLLITVSLIVHPNLPSLMIEVFWSLISGYGILRSVRARRGRSIGR